MEKLILTELENQDLKDSNRFMLIPTPWFIINV